MPGHGGEREFTVQETQTCTKEPGKEMPSYYLKSQLRMKIPG